jgi:hypothetical protein
VLWVRFGSEHAREEVPREHAAREAQLKQRHLKMLPLNKTIPLRAEGSSSNLEEIFADTITTVTGTITTEILNRVTTNTVARGITETIETEITIKIVVVTAIIRVLNTMTFLVLFQIQRNQFKNQI